MGGRFLDYMAQGLAADRPLAADMPSRIAAGAAAIYYANDTGILSFFNEETVTWVDFQSGSKIESFGVATAGDSFINIPLDGKRYRVILSGIVDASGPINGFYFALRVSDDGGATFYSTGDYKNQNNNVADAMTLNANVGPGPNRPNISTLELAGMNADMDTVIITGTSAWIQNDGSLAGTRVDGGLNITGNFNAIQISILEGTPMDGFTVLVEQLA